MSGRDGIERVANEWLAQRVVRSGKVDRDLSFQELVGRHCHDDVALTYLARIITAAGSLVDADAIPEAPGVRAVLSGLSELGAGGEASMMMLDAVLGDLRGRLAAGETLSGQALRDAVTNLPNRLLFADRLDHAVAIANRQDAMVALILIEFDLADARSYHDRVLREVTDRLVHSVREVDTVARLGEKDFAIVVTNIHKRKDGTTVVEKVFEVLSMQFNVEASSLDVPFRVGLSFFPPHGHDAAALLAAGKQALGRAEWASGRNVVVYEDADA